MQAPRILHIVPKLPDRHDGVGTYASNLASELSATCGSVNQFVTGSELAQLRDFSCDHVLLHYANYGYQKRGVPFGLATALRGLRAIRNARVVTVFHELYASAPPWRSAFWLNPFQRRVAQSIARLSDAAVITSTFGRGQLHRLAPEISALVQPVPSNFGEPIFSREQIGDKDPHRWVICGGTALLEKSVASFRRIISRVPEPFYPREVCVLGGRENPAVRRMLNELPGVKWEYQPQVEAAGASDVLSRSSFGWLDYFHRPSAPADALFKSSVFSALNAHGVVTVLPHQTAPLVLERETFPGLFFVDQNEARLPSPDDRGEISWKLYDWYHRHASLKRLAAVIADALRLNHRPVATS